MRTLVIGFGNVHRADDGAAYFVVNILRQRLGQPTLEEDDTGLEGLGGTTDAVLLTQLGPELLDTALDYEQLIFVDAHVREDIPPLHVEPVTPAYAASPFTHHMTPAMFLALLKLLHGRELRGTTVSLRGYDFDFHRGLSPTTEALVEPAVERIMSLLA